VDASKIYNQGSVDEDPQIVVARELPRLAARVDEPGGHLGAVPKVAIGAVVVLSRVSETSLINREEEAVVVLIVSSVVASGAIVCKDEWNGEGDIDSRCVSKEPAV